MAAVALTVAAGLGGCGGGSAAPGTSLFHTPEERDGMLASGMERGLTQSHNRLAELLR
jgi:hypothetical protein